MRATLLIACCLMIAAVVYAATVQEQNQTGLNHLEAGRYAEAVAAFDAARRQLPGNDALEQNLSYAYNAWGVSLSEAGRFREALEKLEAARRLRPEDPLLRTNLATVLVNWGTQMANQGDLTEADRLLNQATQTAAPAAQDEIRKRRSQVAFQRAQRERERNETTRARRNLEEALELDPRNVHALLELADLFYQQGDTLTALDHWLAADQIDPQVPGLADRIERAFREAESEAGFESRSNRHFTVSYEGEVNDQAAEKALAILEEAYILLARELRYRPERKINVVIYTHEQFAIVTISPHWTGGLYDGKIRIPLPGGPLAANQEERLRAVLIHEYVHALVHAMAPRAEVPSWFNEGLAMYYELPEAEQRRRAAADRNLLAELAEDDALPAVHTLPTQFAAMRDQAAVEQAYRVSRGFVHWLMDRYRTPKILELLREVADGAEFNHAVEKTYNRTLAELHEDWRASLL